MEKCVRLSRIFYIPQAYLRSSVSPELKPHANYLNGSSEVARCSLRWAGTDCITIGTLFITGSTLCITRGTLRITIGTLCITRRCTLRSPRPECITHMACARSLQHGESSVIAAAAVPTITETEPTNGTAGVSAAPTPPL